MGAAYTPPFELRKLLIRWTRSPSGGTVEDAAIVTIHFAKLTSGAPDSNWLTADYTAVEARVDTWWTSLKANYLAFTTLAELRWYKDGPVFSPADRANGPSNPAVRSTSRAVNGTSTATQAYPPQVAMSVTKVVDVRKRWGRIYLPAPGITSGDAQGRAAAQASILPAFVTFLNGCRADGKQPVVFTRGRSAYTTVRGSNIAAHDATAYEITDALMDNLFDDVRSRRYSAPTLRTKTTLT